MAQWVKHSSGQGQKWEVVYEYEDEFEVVNKNDADDPHFLPKSEYNYCDPPEQWCETKVNVADKDSLGYQDIKTDGHCVVGVIKLNIDYRVKFLEVERRIT